MTDQTAGTELRESLMQRAVTILITVGMLVAAPALSGLAPLPQDVTAPEKSELPDAEEVHDAFLEAIGGKKVIEDIESTYTTLRVHGGNQIIPFRNRWHRNGPFLIEYEVNTFKNRAGSDGATAWTYTDSRGYELMHPERAKVIHRESHYSAIAISLEDQFPSMRVLSAETFDGRPVYRVSLVNEQAKQKIAFFDRETKLLLALTWSESAPIGDVQVELRFHDWKEFGKVRMWTRLEYTSLMLNQTIWIDDFEVNRMEPDAFALPEEVQALLEKKEAEAAPPTSNLPETPATNE